MMLDPENQTDVRPAEWAECSDCIGIGCNPWCHYAARNGATRALLDCDTARRRNYMGDYAPSCCEGCHTEFRSDRHGMVETFDGLLICCAWEIVDRVRDAVRNGTYKYPVGTR